MLWVLWSLIVFFITLSIILFSFSIDIRYLYSGIKKGVAKTSKAIDKTVELGKQSKIGRAIEFTDSMIQNSNIRLFIPTYNVLVHLAICFTLAGIAFMWINQHINLLISLLFAVLGFILPYSILKFISDYMVERIKRQSVDFLIILKNYIMATGDVFTAFEKSKDFYNEPLKTYVDILVYEFKHKVNPIACIDNFSKRVRYSELRLFMENLKIAYIQGSDIIILIDEFIDQISKLNDDSDREDTEDKILRVGLYILLFLNYVVVYWIFNSKYKSEITGTLLGQVTLIADIISSIYIVYMTLEKQTG